MTMLYLKSMDLVSMAAGRLARVAAASAAIGLAAISGSGTARAEAPFALGTYVGNPDGSDPALEQEFEQNFHNFASSMGVTPTMLDVYVDYTQPVSSWPSNASWQAWSNAQSPVARRLIPVIGFPMASIAGGSMTADQQFQAFAAGTYDSEIAGVVQAWTAQGFASLIMRVGWEMNIEGPTYAGSNAQSQADWVAAFRHIATVLRQAAKADGATMTVVWNAGVTNYSDAEAVNSLYPGSQYVDVIAADMYAGMYPYSDSPGTPTYHDWVTGREDTSVAAFILPGGNRMHYWSYPAATKWSLNGSGGHCQSMDSLMAFALTKRKPFAIPETGAGNSDSGTDVSDDSMFPLWLSETLAKYEVRGLKVAFVNIWAINADGNYEFSKTADDKPNEKAAWTKYISPMISAPSP